MQYQHIHALPSLESDSSLLKQKNVDGHSVWIALSAFLHAVDINIYEIIWIANALISILSFTKFIHIRIKNCIKEETIF